MLASLYQRAGDFDVVHSHLDIWSLPFAGLTDTPTVLTMHGRLDLDHLRDLLPRYGSVPLVSDQRRPAPGGRRPRPDLGRHGLQRPGPHGLPGRPNDRDGYLCFVGRIAEEKGPLAAIEISERTGLPLRMAAKVDPLDIDYYEREVRPRTGANVDFIGEIEEHEKPAFFGAARATLFPSDWPEPFGLVMIESLAAGTPVIALRRGSVPEVIEDGVTGFICDDVDEMVEATQRIGEIDSDACRRHAERFSAERMCRDYVAVYESLIAVRNGPGAAPPPRFGPR